MAEPTTAAMADSPRLVREAAERGDAAALQVQLAAGAAADVADKSGYTPLIVAAWGGHTAVNGAEVEAKGADGSTALLEAASNGHADVANVLLGSGASLAARDSNGNTALSLAAYGGHTSTVNLLLDHGADTSATNNHGETPMSRCSSEACKRSLANHGRWRRRGALVVWKEMSPAVAPTS
ncbi:hypothetical protein FNF27_02517 [Cafeteria roenbergensis]|uniref:Uncharacterized protein n=1 Tax=Cafeteria roenbergensis TaxID=33653 RepID=A0A5A8EFU6_CAFRO|nr:hypothetical protein FNF27_02517 [Cafeteria roenbergensis]